MEPIEIEMHHRAALAYGREASCGTKIDHGSEESAAKAAVSLSHKRGRAFEAYPCVWCDGWHVGREMTQSEREQFS